jgi:tripartite ATP-independent transporter DctM subunit
MNAHVERSVATTHGLLSKIEDAVGKAVEAVTGILVLLEIVILFSGVVARYVMHSPLVWSDELASILFLWLAMLGSVVALRRGAHMRMTALVDKAPNRYKPLFVQLAVAGSLLFVALLLHPSFDYAKDEAFITTPALEISNAWRVSAIFVGVVLMIFHLVTRIIGADQVKAKITAIAIVLAVAAVMYAAKPLLHSLGNLNLVVFFVGVVVVTVLSGFPIAFCFGLATFGYLSLTTIMPPTIVISRMDEGMSHLILLAVPLFVFLGLLIEMTGMARAMVRFLASLLGHVKGGLSYVLIGAMYLVSGISGSKAADMAAIAPALFPEMEKRGAKRGELVALLAATGAQTETVPPSIVLITVGSVTGLSIAALFTGGLLPAVVLGAGLCMVVWRRSRGDTNLSPRASRREIGMSFLAALPAVALPFVIRAAVIEGVATATEVSTIGIAYAIVVGLLIYRQFDLRRIGPMLVETASLSGAILLIIGAATAMAWALTQSGFSRSLAEFMSGLPGGAATFLAVSVVAFIMLGSLLEGIPAIVLFAPLVFPIAHKLGINEIHYSMVMVLAMGLGLFAPPFGVGYYAACAISRAEPHEGMRPIGGYMMALFVGIVVVAAVPWISTSLLK